jgi:hypothetical protein
LLPAALAYDYARRYAEDRRFSFDAGKFGDLAGSSSAQALRRLERSPGTATADEARHFKRFLIESVVTICNRNRIMPGCVSCFASRRVATKALKHKEGPIDRVVEGPHWACACPVSP